MGICASTAYRDASHVSGLLVRELFRGHRLCVRLFHGARSILNAQVHFLGLSLMPVVSYGHGLSYVCDVIWDRTLMLEQKRRL